MMNTIIAATRFMNIHRPHRAPDVVIVASPRSGSTWLFEIVLSSDRFLAINEPLDPNRSNIRRHFQDLNWEKLYTDSELSNTLAFLKKISNGEIPSLKPDMRSPYYRFWTRRTVFKLLQGLEGNIPELSAALSARVIFLLRHPCAVAVSRERVGRLKTFLSSDFQKRFSAKQKDMAHAIIARDCFLHKAVLSWCFENKPVIDNFDDKQLMVFYEKIVEEPGRQFDRIARFLDIPQRRHSHMIHRMNTPSQTISKSDDETQDIFKDGTSARHRLLSKWRRKIEGNELTFVDEILWNFGLHAFYNTECDAPLRDELGWRM